MIDQTIEKRLLDAAVAQGLVSPESLHTVAADLDRWGAVVTVLLGERQLQVGWAVQELERLGESLDGSPRGNGSSNGRRNGRAAEEGSSAAGRYELKDLLGQGGMGLVYRAYDRRLRRAVAVKLLRGDDPDQLARFLREARAQAQVEHENVCKIYETGELDGRPYIAMQLIDGEPLYTMEGGVGAPSKALREMTVEAKVAVMRQVAEGIHAAHRKGLIHRDVKPSNILVEKSDSGGWKPTVVDFGLAREVAGSGVTSLGLAAGTPHFMAPEQARGESDRLDRRTDVYGLGATLYSLLAGRPPFEAKSSLDVLMQVVEGETPPLREVPQDLAIIVGKCLEKEPARRYGSAREVAEELGRYLDGEPILARRTSLGYRLWKKARKHRALVAVSTAALVAVVGLGAVSVRAELRSHERARLAQSFGQEVKAIENLMRLAHLSPLHDVGPEKAAIRRRMGALDARVKAVGELAEGPGSYALGRGHFALGELEEARQQLERAWRQGYREPEVAYTLAEVMGDLYRQELTKAERIHKPEERAVRKREVEAEYRDPALAYLRQAAGVEVDSPDYLAAQLAFLEKRYDAALEKAHAAHQALPWLYEAQRLEGEVHRVMGNELRNRGEHDAAAEAYGRAAAAFDQAAEVGSSDADIYRGLCRLSQSIMEMKMYGRGGDFRPDFQRGTAACETALQIEPDDARTYHETAMLYFRMGERELRRGEDPLTELKAAGEISQKAIALDPSDGAPYYSLGLAHLLEGQFLQSRGRQAWASFEAARDAFLAGLKIDPGSFHQLIGLGYCYDHMAAVRLERGEVPTQLLEEATRAYEQAAEIEPESSYVYNNLAELYQRRATYLFENGEDPRQDAQRAAAALEKAAHLNPGDAIPVGNLGGVSRLEAEYELSRGKDPADRIEQGLRAFDEAAAIDPGNAGFYAGKADLLRLQAAAEMRAGDDPGASLQRAQAAVGEALERDPQHVAARVTAARVALLEGTRAAALGASPAAAWDRAAAALEEAVAVNARAVEAHLVQAELAASRAAWAVRHGGSAGEEIAPGLEAVARALEINPTQNEAEVLRAVLHLLAARSAVRDSGTPASAREALRKALARDGNLTWKYGAYLERGGASGPPAG